MPSTRKPVSSGSLRDVSYKSNPMAVETIKNNSIFTNCVLTDDGDIWWEDMGVECKHGIDWKGQEWTPDKRDADGKPVKGTIPTRVSPRRRASAR